MGGRTQGARRVVELILDGAPGEEDAIEFDVEVSGPFDFLGARQRLEAWLDELRSRRCVCGLSLPSSTVAHSCGPRAREGA